jgi:hypothetical protein
VEKIRELDSLEEFFWLVETGQSVLPVIAAELVGSTSVNNWREAVVAVTKEGLLKRNNYDVEIGEAHPAPTISITAVLKRGWGCGNASSAFVGLWESGCGMQLSCGPSNQLKRRRV